jgi:DNA ligase-1
MTLFAEVVAASGEVASTRARSRKVATLADLLGRVADDELPVTVADLTGEPLQGRIGVGGRTVAKLAVAPVPDDRPELQILDVDRAFTELAGISGAGSQAARDAVLTGLYGRATAAEQHFISRIIVGELRQGALAGVVTDAVAKAAGVPLAAVRRAAMLAGDLPRVAVIARRDGEAGLAGVRLAVLRPVQPMLAQTAESVGEAIDLVGGDASVEWKLDGARIQVHRSGGEVRIFTRNLNDVTGRLPGIVALVRGLPVEQVVLDGEAIGWGGDDGERPDRFQQTMSRFGRRGRGTKATPPEVGPAPVAPDALPDAPPVDPGDLTRSDLDGSGLDARFFDILHVDGEDLLDLPLAERLTRLEEAAGPWRIPGRITSDPTTAREVLDEALAAGHEGVMVKAAGSAYDAGRRGGAWRKVKPVRTFDLVVLAAEWGHGRRRGWLSNLHLGARDPGPPGGFVMVGKTFKGLTDELLTWQTGQLQALAVSGGNDQGGEPPGTAAPGVAGEPEWIVHVRPELVVEIALDGVQVSTRYPGGVALRFARVRRYRTDKDPAEADTIDALRALL